MYFHIVQAQYLGDFVVALTFEDGKSGKLSLAHLHKENSVFSEFENNDYVKNFSLVDGTLSWERGKVELAPERLYHLVTGIDTDSRILEGVPLRGAQAGRSIAKVFLILAFVGLFFVGLAFVVNMSRSESFLYQPTKIVESLVLFSEHPISVRIDGRAVDLPVVFKVTQEDTINTAYEPTNTSYGLKHIRMTQTDAFVLVTKTGEFFFLDDWRLGEESLESYDNYQFLLNNHYQFVRINLKGEGNRQRPEILYNTNGDIDISPWMREDNVF